ncbi:trehalose repressor [Lacunisphaera limnophila]|uniref:Trehalose repressor n=1 Tax=Lacunisphaera limnophila TaxID=1838286 RepID=A0A1D8ART3_9BACT|nr:LacI family DNA-binding transcriptional regulator [Lacunisphaera limnophila]AOS43587.1 trehalose repressor [Lacunisphaera limnophila]
MNVRHIAKLAGVSPSAVSLALRDSPRISAATKARVLALARELHYEPDARIVDLMRHLRKPRDVRQLACFGVISFYDSARPWEQSKHLAAIHDGMLRRARELGYRLEPFWLRAPGMTNRRFSAILETRGVDGLLCFGSPDFDEEFPDELGGQAVVTVGLSIRTPLHRVTSHFYNDTLHALNRVHALGYRRPGLVLGMNEDTRSAYAHSGAYLAWCEHRLGADAALPMLRLREVEEPALTRWLVDHRPDVIVFVHLPDMIARFRAVLKRLQISIPKSLGVVVLSHEVEGSGFAGLQQNQQVMGSWAVELLAARIANRDLGIPVNPRTEMVESKWIEGASLRKR